ncbi:MAG TPA: hypothetical protein VJ652_20130 [Noviherbaspirillum sp.]|nr:hypothetical protein [Noviherbaspirillum sp.]
MALSIAAAAGAAPGCVVSGCVVCAELSAGALPESAPPPPHAASAAAMQADAIVPLCNFDKRNKPCISFSIMLIADGFTLVGNPVIFMEKAVAPIARGTMPRRFTATIP